MGKRVELTDDQIVQVEALAAYLSQDQIADYLGITRPTLAAIFAREPEISLRYKRGKAKVIGKVSKSLIQKALDGDTASMCFFLKTQAGWRETQHIDHTSSDRSMSPAGESAFERVASRMDRLAAAEEAEGDSKRPH